MKKRSFAILLAGAMAISSMVSAGAAPLVLYGEEDEVDLEEEDTEDESEEATEADTELDERYLDQYFDETEDAPEGAEEERTAAEAETAVPQTEAAVRPENAKEKSIEEKEAVVAARTLYSKLKHYADLTDHDQFAACFAGKLDAATLQSQMKAIQAADKATEDLDQHADICYLNPVKDSTQTPYSFGVGLTDYKVRADGTVDWYSILLRVARYDSEWKVSELPSGDQFASLYPEGYEDALGKGRNAVDFYPYLAMRFSDQGVFAGAFYSLVNMAWQNEDGSLSLALWLANGQEGTKWCDSMDLTLQDGDTSVTSVRVPVQQVLESGESKLVTVTIPAEDVTSGKVQWQNLTVQSNLLYQ